jgi:hypothetical protein
MSSVSKKICAECGNANPDNWIACGNCGAGLSASAGAASPSSPKRSTDNRSSVGTTPSLLPSKLHDPSSTTSKPTAESFHLSPTGQILGLIGAFCLLLGVFCPAISILGVDKSYLAFWSHGGIWTDYGHILLVVAGFSVIFSLFRSHEQIMYLGWLALGATGWSLYKTYSIISVATSATGTSDADEAAARFVQQGVHMGWGWGILFIAAVFLIVASLNTEPK